MLFREDETDAQWGRTTTAKQRMGSANGSIRERYSLAKDYKEIAKNLFIIVEVNRYHEMGYGLILCRLLPNEPPIKLLWLKFRKPRLRKVCSFTCLLIFKDLMQFTSPSTTLTGNR